MPRRPGVQREILASLALVMVLATAVPTVLFVAHHEAGAVAFDVAVRDDQQVAGRAVLRGK